MTSATDKITKGSDGIYRHPSGNPCSAEFHKLMARDSTSITAATRSVLKSWRAEKAVRGLRAARVTASAEPLERFWRARLAGTALRAALRRA